MCISVQQAGSKYEAGGAADGGPLCYCKEYYEEKSWCSIM